MKIMDSNDYREILRAKVKSPTQPGLKLTWKKIAARVPVQYTYLSRALNRKDTHLSEDHLHEICKLLHFFPDEIEYLLALRSLEVATSQSRKDFLNKKILAMRQSARINAPAEAAGPVSGEIHFVLSPLAWITYFALGVKEYRENPRKIAQVISIDPAQLRTLLHSLHDLGLIEIGENIFDVKKVNKNHFHYSFDHPLTHLHQQMLRLLCDSHYLRVPEARRHRFMVTFNADAPAVAKIEELFYSFVKEVEKVAVQAPSKGTYQMNFELFPWLQA